jgi:regulator of sigma E protease
MDLLTFIAGIAILILLHEFGHFIAARSLKVPVEEFGVGFPPRLVGTARDQSGKRRWFGARPPEDIDPHSMILSINWLPLGGFVRPRGENDPAVPGGLAAASPWVRLGVLFAGPVMNLLIGVVLAIYLTYTLGERIPEKVIIASISPGSPAAEAGLQINDQFLQLNGQTINSVELLQKLIDEQRGQEVTLLIQRGDQTQQLVLVPRKEPPTGEGPMGVGLTNPTRPIGLLTAVDRGVGAVYDNVRGILLLPVRLLTGQARPQEGRLVGYKGMYDIYTRIQSPLWFFMIISISLGIMNLLPIPAVDGGRILFVLPEILFRRRIPAQYENAIHLVGFALLILLLIYINVQDFVNPIQLP